MTTLRQIPMMALATIGLIVLLGLACLTQPGCATSGGVERYPVREFLDPVTEQPVEVRT